MLCLRQVCRPGAGLQAVKRQQVRVQPRVHVLLPAVRPPQLLLGSGPHFMALFSDGLRQVPKLRPRRKRGRLHGVHINGCWHPAVPFRFTGVHHAQRLARALVTAAVRFRHHAQRAQTVPHHVTLVVGVIVKSEAVRKAHAAVAALIRRSFAGRRQRQPRRRPLWTVHRGAQHRPVVAGCPNCGRGNKRCGSAAMLW